MLYVADGFEIVGFFFIEGCCQVCEPKHRFVSFKFERFDEKIYSVGYLAFCFSEGAIVITLNIVYPYYLISVLQFRVLQIVCAMYSFKQYRGIVFQEIGQQMFVTP